MHAQGLSREQAEALLKRAHGHLRHAMLNTKS
jgi:N-acetylmuramic acid 6-phosphate (MurNAc-6-P) etherase